MKKKFLITLIIVSLCLHCNKGSALAPAPNIPWTLQTSLPTMCLNGLVYGKGIFVATGGNNHDTGLIMTSADGITWNSKFIRMAYGFTSFPFINFCNGLFIISDYGDTIITSPDGINWTERAVGYCFNSIAGNGNIFVATNLRSIATSPDGITWTDHTPTSLNVNAAVVACNGSMFVVGACDSNFNNTIITSSDGLNWSRLPILNKYSPLSLYWTGNHFIETTQSEILTSIDGMSWTQRLLQNGWVWNNLIAWNDSSYISVGIDDQNHRICFTSKDGISNWIARNPPPVYPTGFAYGNGRFVIIGSDTSYRKYDNHIYTSP